MSDGKTHATATTALVFPVAMTSMLLMPHDPLSGAIIGGIGCLTGLIIDPDLDIENITRSEWQVIKRFWIFGMLWVVFWYPYARAIPHRSPLSHWPLIGTAGRVFYLLLWVKLLGVILGGSVGIVAIVSQPGMYDPALKRQADMAYCWVDLLNNSSYGYGNLAYDWGWVQ